MFELSGSTALVTGAGRGIGKAVARALHFRGASVFLADVNASDAGNAAKEIDSTGQKAIPVQADVTDAESVRKMIDFAAQRTGKIDILVNNAGWDRIRPFMKTDPDFWDRVIRINYRGVLNTVFEACRIMCGQDNGRIINIASDAALVGSMGEAVYVTGQVLSVSGGLTMSS